ncbi:glycerol-3-phosphate dehydrogenase/oxidase [Ideonella sp. DXS29W]|uniref:Glycerol-3-phosphate dehydrogenase/oxidase n=1 Tax=Ideonella lacteola TaxID=2984193 RepID=A0ABU9BGW8_9BURK
MSVDQLRWQRPGALAGRHFSVVVIGAGINGVGVFRDLCLQGVDCLLIDKGDVAAGASSAPSRMIHGGLRYLEHGSFSLVAEATRERNLLLRNAPHLVKPLKTVVPLSNRFGGLLSSVLRFTRLAGSPSARGLFVVSLGLRLYDLLGRRHRVMPEHRVDPVSRHDMGLFRPDVRWAATFYDAFISHPEWLILELLGDGCRDEQRSVVANYCKLEQGTGKTLSLRDELTGETVQLTCDVVVNATGAWLDRCAGALDADSARVMGTKGSHLVLDHPALRRLLEGRMAYFEASDGRVCIAYPFLDQVLVGSTDIPVDDPDQAATDPAEVGYLLGVLREMFPRLPFERKHVLYTFVGVRPLARSRADQPGGIARDHSVAVDPPSTQRQVPVVGLVGGKWTTFRALAELATDEVLTWLRRGRRRSTEPLPIGGGAHWPAHDKAKDNLVADIQAAGGLGRQRAIELLNRYGSVAVDLAERFAADGDAMLARVPGYSAAELRYLCRQTGVAHLDDLVLRRTLLAIGGRLTAEALNEMATIAAKALGWDARRQSAELQRCRVLLRERHGVALAEVPPTPRHAPSFDASLPARPLPTSNPT